MNAAAEQEPVLDVDGLTVEEVGALWAFLHGDIMEPGIRTRIREHWGLCPRHAWGHALVEIELWESGAGARGGHQPFDVGVLHDDLINHMIGALSHRHIHPRALRRAGECYLCQQLGGETGHAIGYAGFDSTPLTEEANRMTYTQQWLSQTKHIWERAACPLCTESDTGQLCRPHLLEGGIDASSSAATAAYLSDVDRRLKALVDSMTEHGAPSAPADDAAWAEAVAWFTGWTFPQLVLEHNAKGS